MPATDTSLAEVTAMFAVNVFGPMRMVRVFHPLLIRSRGKIVNIGSVGGVVPYVYGCECPISPFSLSLFLFIFSFPLPFYLLFPSSFLSPAHPLPFISHPPSSPFFLCFRLLCIGFFCIPPALVSR